MTTQLTVNQEKALEVLLYLASRCDDLYRICKCMYFADRLHLERYGRLICDDTYVAMEYGPTPSKVYDMMKDARDDRTPDGIDARLVLHVDRVTNKVKPLRDPDTNQLSESDIECLDEAISKAPHGFSLLKHKAHDAAYDAAVKEDLHEIPIEYIARTLQDGDALVEYLRGS